MECFMQEIHNHQGEYPGKSTVTFLPMIDMDPSDNNCIYSTLKFVCRMARKYEMTAILTIIESHYYCVKMNQMVVNLVTWST